MRTKLMVLGALSSLSTMACATDYTNFIIINLDDVGYGDFSFNGAYRPYGCRGNAFFSFFSLSTN